ncbi:hypothetical protein GCM10019016_071370 [Streptomyces prasinosporus]|uniref:Uncharacterized protein n=1 Tax=Streptomyces prasinosporus TaxID=68256 RepID=A0ABP6TXF5_9ACTN
MPSIGRAAPAEWPVVCTRTAMPVARPYRTAARTSDTDRAVSAAAGRAGAARLKTAQASS